MYLLILKLFLTTSILCSHLHPTMYLLILSDVDFYDSNGAYLHPTMYLLIPSSVLLMYSLTVKFTSHYVSINSLFYFQSCKRFNKFTSHYVSINSIYPPYSITSLNTFTSHYVSINSDNANIKKLVQTNLHPTMYLLIRRRCQKSKRH